MTKYGYLGNLYFVGVIFNLSDEGLIQNIIYYFFPFGISQNPKMRQKNPLFNQFLLVYFSNKPMFPLFFATSGKNIYHI